jgi:hypothetical protein
VTKSPKFKKAIRARMAETGEKYTEARRELGAAGGDPRPLGIPTEPPLEPHYVFTPPATIERVDATGRRYLEVPEEVGPGFMWGYNGTGPNTAAWALLLDATGSCDLELAISFADDNLAWWEEIGEKSFVMTVAEVAAWRLQVEPRVRRVAAEGDSARTYSYAEMGERFIEHQRAVALGQCLPWWKAYRAEHGEPFIG